MTTWSAGAVVTVAAGAGAGAGAVAAGGVLEAGGLLGDEVCANAAGTNKADASKLATSILERIIKSPGLCEGEVPNSGRTERRFVPGREAIVSAMWRRARCVAFRTHGNPNSPSIFGTSLRPARSNGPTSWREKIMKRILLATGLAIAFAGAAYAQTTTTTEYYVVQDASTKKCTIVDKKPTTTTSVVVGNGVFKTRTEAETGMKSVKVCTTN
jgi:hypothetical protein